MPTITAMVHAFRRKRHVTLRLESSRTACKMSLEPLILTSFGMAAV